MTIGPGDFDRSLQVTVDLHEGEAEGIRRTTLADWQGSWLDFPRASLKSIQSYPELDRAGIYLLVTNPDVVGAQTELYIGQTRSLRVRLSQHDASKNSWQRAYVLTRQSDSQPLNQAHVAYLEARMIEIAKAARRAKIRNAQSPKASGLGSQDEVQMSRFLRNALILVPLIGVNAFNNPAQISSPGELSNDSRPKASRNGDLLPRDVEAVGSAVHFFLTTKTAYGEAIYEKSGFTVLEGAIGRRKERSMTRTYRQLREQLLSTEVLAPISPDQLRLTRHYTFGSPSAAASVLVGGSVNGRGAWKTLSGETLADWEAESKH